MKSIISIEVIERQIFSIRGQRVMLDRDLANLYGVETRVLNQAVRRNISRFPADFMFSLTREEIMRISQIVISSMHPGNKTLKFSKNVMAFSEQGVAMLSTVLNSERAVKVNIEIMRAFVRLRQMLASNAELARNLEALEKKYDAQFKIVFDAIRQIMAPTETKEKKIGFRGRERIPRYRNS